MLEVLEVLEVLEISRIESLRKPCNWYMIGQCIMVTINNRHLRIRHIRVRLLKNSMCREALLKVRN